MKENPPKFSAFASRNFLSTSINPSLFTLIHHKKDGPVSACEHCAAASVLSPDQKNAAAQLTFTSNLIVTGIHNLVNR